MAQHKRKKRPSRYSKMKKVAKKAERKIDEFPRIGFKELTSEWWRYTNVILRSKIFRRTALIATSFLLMGAGTIEVQRSKAAMEQEMAMTVSPSNEPTQFALSGVTATFKPQFRSGDTYIVPFEIDGLENLSLNPEDYIVQLQGTNTMSDLNMSARLVLFGTSGRGAIVMEGEYTGEPMNIYLISTNSLMGNSGERVEVTSEEIIEMQAEQGSLIINQQADGTSDEEQSESVQTGTITIGGQEMVVGVDMVATRLNPSAENVTPTYREVTIDSTMAEIYDVTFGAVDRSVTLTNKENAVVQRNDVIDMIEEYNDRLDDDPNISEEDANTIREANQLAIDNMGEPEINERITELLMSTDAYSPDEVSEATSDNVPVSEMTEEQRREFMQEQLSNSGVTITQQTSTIDALDELRVTVSDLNYQIALYDAELEYIDEVAVDQDEMGRSAVRYEVLSPFG